MDILIPPMAVELDMTNAERPWLSFGKGSHFVFINKRNQLAIQISRVEALFLYKGIPISCVLGEKPMTMYGKSQVMLDMNATKCDREGRYTHNAFPYTANLTEDAKKGKVRMGMTMNIRAGYKHRPWGWEVLLRPSCTDFVIHVVNKGTNRNSTSNSKNVDGDGKLFLGIGTISCEIADPLWTK
ncbi:hypothetical protein LINGRAHAP2_LOCUS25142 [Linum grandiflorum]